MKHTQLHLLQAFLVPDIPTIFLRLTPVMWIGRDVADNPAWRCTETRCSYSVQQREGYAKMTTVQDCLGATFSCLPMSWYGYKEAHATSAFVQPSCSCLTNSPTLQN